MQMRRARPSSGVARQDVTAIVKWFNPTKGFGFVQPTDGSPDAFLHISVVEQAGHRDLAEGTTIVCDLAEGGRGLQVAAIRSVEAAPSGGGFAPAPGRFAADEEPVEGVVKFFNAEKGFGFVTPEDGGKDVFISARTLERAGLGALESDQRVRMTIRRGQKGPMAESIELLI